MRKKTVLWYINQLEIEKRRRRDIYYKIARRESLYRHEIDTLDDSLRKNDTYITMLAEYVRGRRHRDKY
jgi:hypothetical protein